MRVRLALKTVARCVVMACTIMPAAWVKRESEAASRTSMLTVMASSFGTLRKLIALSCRSRRPIPRGPRSGRFLWYGELSSQPLRRCFAGGRGVPNGMCW